MSKILILCNTDLSGDPRPNKMASFLVNMADVTVIAKNRPNIEKTRYIIIDLVRKRSFIEKVGAALDLKLYHFERFLWTKHVKKAKEVLQSKSFNLIVVYGLELLPLAHAVKGNASILFDAREYYPRQREDQFLWRFFYQDFTKYICSKYMNRCDRIITVCEGLSAEYEKEFRVQSEVIMSLPYDHDCSPSKINQDKIKLIHHGCAAPSRKLEKMIEMMDFVNSNYTLDLMLVPSSARYLEQLKKKVINRDNVNIIEPVLFEEIIPFTNKYDIGVFLLPPNTFNHKFVLPNKLFEFIQARLAVAIGPSPEMAGIVEKWDCGIVSNDFEPKSLADKLNSIDISRIIYFKNRSDLASATLNHKNNEKKVRKIILELLNET